jgi:hypothetical protein
MPERKTKKTPDETYTSNSTPSQLDERGKRKIDPSVAKILKDGTGALPDGVGNPVVKGSDEQKAFDDAYALIEKLKTDKSSDQYF